MAIAPSKLGALVLRHRDADDVLLRELRTRKLVKDNVADQDVVATFEGARQEHAALSESGRPFNSPHERVRVFLEPYLTRKGRRWAEPITSLRLGDD